MEAFDNLLPGTLVTIEKKEHLPNVLDSLLEEGFYPHILLEDKSHPLFKEIPKEAGPRDLILITIRFRYSYEA